MLAVILLIWRQPKFHPIFGTTTAVNSPQPTVQNQSIEPELGPRHQFNYQQWLEVLQQEAKAAADKHPQHLTVLAGDSLSLWFPHNLLPEGKSWLNQGISGETSGGLLKRLNFFDQTQPETILVMIGINDLIHGLKDEEILNHQQEMIIYLKRTHPETQIIVQSILPHGGEETITWEGRSKLLAIPNSRIHRLNNRLRRIANRQGVRYINLYPLFANSQGNLRQELTSDGLHLNPQGYLVWRTALQIYIDHL
jgi:lysophospholipase L1-like esterase